MMRSVVLLTICTLAVAIFAVEPRYIGSDRCAKMCHKGEKKGKQYEVWQKSKHAAAFKTLGTPEAKAVAKKVGVAADPQTAPECLRCHVTAYGVKKELVDSTCTYAEGLGCESCHGPGSEYRKLNIMKNHDLAVAAGMVGDYQANCIKCHNKESPNYKPFDLKEAIKKDVHLIPGKVRTK